MNKKVGFIGCGNMGKAILNGLISGQILTPDAVFIHNYSPASTARVAAEFGVHEAEHTTTVAEQSDIIFIGVKPYAVTEILQEIAPSLKAESIIISIAAGVTLSTLEAALPASCKVVRLMPNTPALVNAGMTSVTPNKFLTEADTALVMSLCRSFGRAEIVPESLIDAVIGVSGSAPAYVFMFIEAMADAAVAGGMPRKQAYEFAAQTVMGAAKMVLETGKHPGDLKDMVCSPGGTTIEAVAKLEETGLRRSVIAGVRSAIEKSQEMSRK
ncbi:MAG TPA: pyrroline-5-carboxylate reductase [Morganella sp. (in: Bacteria)]|nr:pyrroline-5-carboxylate reductase [Morganella sp. (in: enterobacteria)]